MRSFVNIQDIKKTKIFLIKLEIFSKPQVSSILGNEHTQEEKTSQMNCEKKTYG